MHKSSQIDGAWFKQQFERAGLSLREVARRLPAGKQGKPLDPSALSRALKGTRKMSVSEAVNIARILKVSESIVLEKALGETAAEDLISRQPEVADAAKISGSIESETADASGRPQSAMRRHPAWGVLKGTTIVMPGVDLTEPTAPEWGQLDGQ